LREKLLLEIGSIPSPDLATGWARDALAAKNSLTASDAKLVEDAFERRLSEFPSSEIASNAGSSETQAVGPQENVANESTDAGPTKGIDKSLLGLPHYGVIATGHLRSVAKQAS
jgi:hypothetical protein